MIEMLSKSITKLMESPEKPESPVEFIRANMGLTQKELDQINFLKEEVEVYKKQVNDLKVEIAGLKLERQEIVENAVSKEVVPDATAKDEIVSESPSDKQNDVESKKTEEVLAEPTQVLGGKIADDVQKGDVPNDVKVETLAVSEVTEVKTEPKPEDIKTEDKPAGDASEPTDK